MWQPAQALDLAKMACLFRPTTPHGMNCKSRQRGHPPRDVGRTNGVKRLHKVCRRQRSGRYLERPSPFLVQRVADHTGQSALLTLRNSPHLPPRHRRPCCPPRHCRPHRLHCLSRRRPCLISPCLHVHRQEPLRAASPHRHRHHHRLHRYRHRSRRCCRRQSRCLLLRRRRRLRRHRRARWRRWRRRRRLPRLGSWVRPASLSSPLVPLEVHSSCCALWSLCSSLDAGTSKEISGRRRLRR